MDQGDAYSSTMDFPRVIQGKQREMLDSRFALPACAVLAPFERPRDDQRTENGETEKGGRLY